MKKLFVLLLVALASVALGVSSAFAVDAVSIVKPPEGAITSSPVEICMETFGLQVEPAKKGVNDGKGHHHLLIDVDLPSDLSSPIGKDANHIHMGDGSTCKELKMSPGKHIIKALFAQGNHVPFTPPVTATIFIIVK